MNNPNSETIETPRKRLRGITRQQCLTRKSGEMIISPPESAESSLSFHSRESPTASSFRSPDSSVMVQTEECLIESPFSASSTLSYLIGWIGSHFGARSKKSNVIVQTDGSPSNESFQNLIDRMGARLGIRPGMLSLFFLYRFSEVLGSAEFQARFRESGTVPSLRIPRSGQSFLVLSKEFLRGSGIGRADEDTHIYVREAFRKQIDFLVSRVIADEYCGLIFGQPGTGKSLATYFVTGALCRDEWTVVWIHVSSEKVAQCERSCSCVVLQKSRKLTANFDMEDLTSVLRSGSLLFSGGKEILVFDGFTSDPVYSKLHDATFFWWREDNINRRLIHVSSMATMAGRKPSKLLQVGIVSFAQFSWTLDEAKLAMKDSGFAKNVSKFLDADPEPGQTCIEKLESKFFYAGGSARYLFQMTTAEVMRDIDSSLESVAHIKDLQDLCMGVLSKTTAHSLLNVYDMQVREIISAYAACRIAFTLGPGYLRTLASSPLFSGIPYMKGGFLEIFFFANAKTGKISLRNKFGTIIVWETRGACAIFNPVFPHPVDCTKNTWLMPKKWNQPGYDGVYLYDDLAGRGCIRFVQVTQRQNHDVKLAYFREVIDMLFLRGIFTTKVVEIFFIVPYSKQAGYKIGKIESSDCLSDLGWPSTEEEVLAKIGILGIDFD